AATPTVAAGRTPAGRTRRPRVVVTSTFGVYPPRGGGQNRLYYLYRALASEWDVEIVSVARSGEPAYRGEIAPGVFETRIPKTRRHAEAETALEARIGQPVTDVAMPRLIALTPDYEAALRAAVAGARWIVASHPYLLPAIEAVRGSVPLVYEAHNVEVDLKERALAGSRAGRDLLGLTRAVEGAACREATLITACSRADADRLDALYGDVAGKAAIVPNGVDLASVPFVPASERAARKQACGLGDGLLALFMGAWHPPNLEAAEHLLGYARELPDVTFLLVGSVCSALEGRSLPGNVAPAGVVDDAFKAFLLSCADVALNPMVSGRGRT
ncbi:MAG: glycosyltransferase, partial [Candidatus Sericytochromatia bacterium]|nr:glycosyltransferase [Candidatus Tanganyikabacteria bacterium]